MRITKATLGAITVGVALTACVQQQELIPLKGQSPQTYNRDREGCIGEVKRTGGYAGDPSTSDLFLECMKAKGYKLSEKM